MKRARFKSVLLLAVVAALVLPATMTDAKSRHGGSRHRHHHQYHSRHYSGYYHHGYPYWGWGIGVPLSLSFGYVSPPVYRYERVRYVERLTEPSAPQPRVVVYQRQPSGPSPEALMLERARQRSAAPATAPLFGLDDIKQLTASGLGDEVIIGQLRQSGAVFRLTTDEIIQLKEDGVSDAVIGALINTGRPSASAAN